MFPIPVINITSDSIFRIFEGGGASEPRGGHLSLGSGARGGASEPATPVLFGRPGRTHGKRP